MKPPIPLWTLPILLFHGTACDYQTKLTIPDETDTGDSADTASDEDTSDTGLNQSDPATDDDGDGLSENDGDCDDSDESVFPGSFFARSMGNAWLLDTSDAADESLPV